MRERQAPIGVILAGGLGRRIGGSKALVKLRGRPLLMYGLEALAAVLDEVAIIAKPDTQLPSLSGVTVWLEPTTPRHPLVGITHALALADGRPVLACAGDLPLVTPELIRRISEAQPAGSLAVLAAHQGEMQPLLGCYQPSAAERLGTFAATPNVPLRKAVAAIEPRLIEVEDPDALFNVNSPDDLLQAAAILDHRPISRT
jgi:molybdenum cofactor guanylyltransferase